MSYHWQKNRAQPHHVDDWLMTYADVITLLLCFFAIVIMTSVTKKHPQTEQPKPIIIVEPKPPMPKEQLFLSPVPSKLDVPGYLPFHTAGQDQAAPIPDPVPALASAASDDAEAMQAPPAADEALAPPAIAIAAPAPALPLPAIVASISAQVPAKIEEKGDRITAFEMPSAAFFDSGSAVLSKSGQSILRNVADSLKTEEYKTYQVTVEGHTDDTPIHTLQFPSNWELSTARASSVVHYLLDQEIPAQRLRAAGYADTFPKAPNRDSTGKPIAANRAENRRVVIRLEKIENK